jgi:hypothetical protein
MSKVPSTNYTINELPNEIELQSITKESPKEQKRDSKKEEKIIYDYVVYLNDPNRNAQQKHPSNYISTTKYTWYNFIPKNLWHQLVHRLSNIYFIVTMIFALIPGVSPIFPITSILPVVFILGTTAIKDAYEDFVINYIVPS